MTSDNCAVCGERTRYDGHEIAHSCAGGAPASNLPERDHGLVSIFEMNGQIAEAVAAERQAIIGICDQFVEGGGWSGDACMGVRIVRWRIWERVAKLEEKC